MVPPSPFHLYNSPLRQVRPRKCHPASIWGLGLRPWSDILTMVLIYTSHYTTLFYTSDTNLLLDLPLSIFGDNRHNNKSWHQSWATPIGIHTSSTIIEAKMIAYPEPLSIMKLHCFLRYLFHLFLRYSISSFAMFTNYCECNLCLIFEYPT